MASPLSNPLNKWN